MIKFIIFEVLFVLFFFGVYFFFSGIYSLVVFWVESFFWWFERYFVWKIYINLNLEKYDFVRFRLMFWKYRICLFVILNLLGGCNVIFLSMIICFGIICIFVFIKFKIYNKILG